MRISCVLKHDEIEATPADVIVFPEGVNASDLCCASDAHPDSIIVGTQRYGNYCRAVLMHHHRNRIDYFKIGSDGRTSLGCGEGLLENPLEQHPIYETADICVGVLVCMDVDNVQFLIKVTDLIKASDRKTKVLCIPADMASWWFSGGALNGPYFDGMYVALSNQAEFYVYPARCQSFITDTAGKKLAVQDQHSPLHHVFLSR